jgi:hypothetical protein
MERPLNLRHLVGWAIGTLVLAGAYLFGFATIAERPQMSVLLAHPLQLCAFVLVYLGWPLTQSTNLWITGSAGLAGLVFLRQAVSIAWQNPSDRRAIQPWLWLSGYALLAAVLAAASLLEKGIESASADGYSTASFFWIGFAVTAVVALRRRSSEKVCVTAWPRRALILAVTALAVHYVWRYQQGYVAFAQDHKARTVGLTELYRDEADQGKAALGILDADTDLMRKNAHLLEQRSLGPFSLSMSEERRRLLNAVIPATNVVEGDGFLDRADCSAITGWAWDRQQPDVPVKIDIYDGEVLLGTTPADGFRRDLLDSHVGNGRHSFDYFAPPHKLAGAHTIHARISGMNRDLDLSPKHLVCE